jgi:hypothetical protein
VKKTLDNLAANLIISLTGWQYILEALSVAGI